MIRKKRKTTGPGDGKKGRSQQFNGSCRAVRSSDGLTWKVRLDKLPASGSIELWPEEESRGKDSRPIKVKSCAVGGSKIAADKFSVAIPMDGGSSQSFFLELEREVNIVDMRPQFKEDAS